MKAKVGLDDDYLHRKRTGYHFAPLTGFAARLHSTVPFGSCQTVRRRAEGNQTRRDGNQTAHRVSMQSLEHLRRHCCPFRDSILERDYIQCDCINLARQLSQQRKILLAPH